MKGPKISYENNEEIEIEPHSNQCVTLNARQWDIVNHGRTHSFDTDWYHEQKLKQLAVTVAINNVSYDITVSGDYIYSANWAGGIRRIKFRNNSPIIEGEELNWEILPLPQDVSYNLNCSEIFCLLCP